MAARLPKPKNFRKTGKGSCSWLEHGDAHGLSREGTVLGKGAPTFRLLLGWTVGVFVFLTGLNSWHMGNKRIINSGEF